MNMETGREDCPNREVRAAFARGSLSLVMAKGIAKHFSNCDKCAEELRDLSFTRVEQGNSLLEECFDAGHADKLRDIVLAATEERNDLPETKEKLRSRPEFIEDLPSSIGRYEILGSAGVGSFGVVYRAQHPLLKKDVAVKVSHAKLDRSDMRRMFFREAETAALLDHENIVRVLDADELADGRCFIVFEFVGGRPLRTFKRIEKTEFDSVMQLFCQILKGVSHAHKKGIIHRDLKPSNILVDKNGVAKIADFGLAFTKQTIPRVRDFAGTLNYMAPEQLRCEIQKIDARTDIYALGLILYEQITGKKPRRTHADELEEKIFPGWDSNANIPRELKRICEKCCSEHQKARYSSAGELLEEIEDWLTSGAKYRSRVADAGRKTCSVGLMPYGLEHANMYSSLISEPATANDLRDSIVFWKRRIERMGFEPSFQVGLISGPSGCGKTSFVKAGLIPCLSTDIKVINIDCRRQDMSIQLSEFFDRLDDQKSSKQKALLILDHFCLGLVETMALGVSGLVRALRQCDGDRYQCLLVVEEPNLNEALEVFESIDVVLDPRENFLLMVHPNEELASNLLLQLGVSNGCVLNSDDEQLQHFIESAIALMKSSDSLDYPTLHVFYHLMRTRAWVPDALRDLSNVSEWRALFLEERFGSQSTNEQMIRVLAEIARARDFDNIDFFSATSNCGEQTNETNLLRQLRLAPPIIDNHTRGSGGVFVAQHYLSQVIHDFIERGKNRASWASRQLLALHGDAHIWQAGLAKEHLCSFIELVKYSLVFSRVRSSATIRNFLWISLREITKKLAITMLVVGSILAGLSAVFAWNQANAIANSRCDTIQDSYPFNLPWSNVFLERVVRDSSKSAEARVNAAFAVSRLGDCPATFLASQLPSLSRDYQGIAIAAMMEGQNREEVIGALANQRKDYANEEFEPKCKNAVALAFLDQPGDLEELLRRDSPTSRVHIVAHLSEWYEMPTVLELLKKYRHSALLASALMNSIELEEVEKFDDDALRNLINELEDFFSAPETSSRSAAWRVLTSIDCSFENSIHPQGSKGGGWFVNVDGLTMAMLPGSNAADPIYMSVLETRFDDIVRFKNALPDNEFPLICAYPGLCVSGLPASCVMKETAFEYCNYLSEKEGRKPYYIKTGERQLNLRNMNLGVGTFEVDLSASGYRLPTAEHWNRATMVSDSLSFLGHIPDKCEAQKKFANFDSGAGELLKTGQKLPNCFGFFDLIGNSFELYHPVEGDLEVVLLGGSYLTRPEKILDVLDVNEGHVAAPFVGFRVCCPPK